MTFKKMTDEQRRQFKTDHPEIFTAEAGKRRQALARALQPVLIETGKSIRELEDKYFGEQIEVLDINELAWKIAGALHLERDPGQYTLGELWEWLEAKTEGDSQYKRLSWLEFTSVPQIVKWLKQNETPFEVSTVRDWIRNGKPWIQKLRERRYRLNTRHAKFIKPK